MVSQPRPWQRESCSSSPRRTRPCPERSGSTTPTSWPTPTADSGARVFQYQVKIWEYVIVGPWAVSFYSIENKCTVPISSLILSQYKLDLVLTIDFIFYSFPSSTLDSIDKIELHLSEPNSYSTKKVLKSSLNFDWKLEWKKNFRNWEHTSKIKTSVCFIRASKCFVKKDWKTFYNSKKIK